MKQKRNHTDDSAKKVELANRIAKQQSKNVYNVYSNLEEALFRGIRFLSSVVDNIIFSKRYMPIVSLILAMALYFSVNYDKDNGIFGQSLQSSKTLTGVNVVSRYNSESFEISGLPKSCEVVLTGDAANVNNAASKQGACVVNLEGYTEGTHLVKVSTTGYGESVSSTVNPSDAMVTLKRKTTAKFSVDYDFVNMDKVDSKYILSEPTFIDGDKVNIRASQDTLDSIAFVKVLIDVGGVSQDFEKEASLIAYDKSGNVVNADIYPSTVKVAVKVTSPHKTVPIVLNVNGEVPNNMSIDTISMDRQTTVIYAPEAVLSTIEQVSVELDASTLSRDTQVAMPITLPNGVSSADVTIVNLDVKLSETKTKTIENVPINYKNNNNNYGVKIEANQTKINVQVSGSAANIEKISAADIFIYVDMADLKPGTYDMPLIVQKAASSSYVKYSIGQLTLKMTIEGE